MPKEIILIRHAQKDEDGQLTEAGKLAARELGNRLTEVDIVVSSKSHRAQETAELISNQKTQVRDEAYFFMADPETSAAINVIAREKNISFYQASLLYDNKEQLAAVEQKALEIDKLIEDLLQQLPENGRALVVTHDLSLIPWLASKARQRDEIGFLEGIVYHEDSTVTDFS